MSNSLSASGSLRVLTVLLLVLLIPSGCGSQSRLPEDRWKTTPVYGKVVVDGVPQEGVTVTATPSPGAEIAYSISSIAGADGSFQFSTDLSGDGLPGGEYTLTFELLEKLPHGAGRDLLNSKYSKVENSNVKINVLAEAPLTLEPVALKLKK